jgi:2-methylcitrate dehydratase PrpD
MFGTDTKTLHMGRAAQNGILAANLAAHGFGSCARPIESWLRLVSTTVEEGELSALAGEGEGEGDWQILQNTFKPYPCGIVIHPLIDGCLEAYEQLHSMEPGEESFCERIVSVDVVVNPQCVRLCSVRHPKNGLETIFSLYHGCAVSLVCGRAGPAEFSDHMASENVQVASTRDKVNVRTDGEVRDDEAYLTIKYKRLGETGILESSFHIEHATGSLARPMTLEQLERKFLDQASPVLGSDKAVRTTKACWKLEDMSDIADLAKLLVP